MITKVGLGPEGIRVKRLPEILSNFENGLKAAFGNELSLDPSTPEAQLNGIYAEDLVILYEMVEDIYVNFHPNFSSGDMLDLVSAIRGIYRKPATATRVEIILTGTDGIIVPAGTLFRATTQPEVNFSLETPYYIGTTTSGWVVCTETGPIEVLANTLTEVINPFAGLDSVNNPSNGFTGTNTENDAELRNRSNRSVSIPAVAIVDGMWSGLADIDGVTDVAVYENDSNFTDSQGIPPKSMYAVVQGGKNEDIAQVIYSIKTIGCGMLGSVTVTVFDSNDNPHDIKFDRPTLANTHIFVDVKSLSGWSQGDEDRIRNDLLNYVQEGDPCTAFNGYTIGESVYASDLYPAITGNAVRDKFHITNIQVGDSGSNQVDVRNILANEVAAFDVTNIVVNVT